MGIGQDAIRMPRIEIVEMVKQETDLLPPVFRGQKFNVVPSLFRAMND
jgi:hypothetical protein